MKGHKMWKTPIAENDSAHPSIARLSGQIKNLFFQPLIYLHAVEKYAEIHMLLTKQTYKFMLLFFI